MAVTWDKNPENETMRIIKEDCIGLVVDIQERLLPVMEERESFLKRCGILLGGLKLLEVPLLVTEQYPRGLGSTVPGVANSSWKRERPGRGLFVPWLITVGRTRSRRSARTHNNAAPLGAEIHLWQLPV